MKKPKGWRGETRRHRIAALKGARKKTKSASISNRPQTKKEIQYSKIARHGEDIKRIFRFLGIWGVMV